VETFTCPRCGGKTDYDPDQVGREMRLEEEGGQPFWCDYARARCAHCGHEALVLRDRKPP
jgi:DNA-directed RNA polymerase subunit RPC12/RpoP